MKLKNVLQYIKKIFFVILATIIVAALPPRFCSNRQNNITKTKEARSKYSLKRNIPYGRTIRQRGGEHQKKSHTWRCESIRLFMEIFSTFSLFPIHALFKSRYWTYNNTCLLRLLNCKLTTWACSPWFMIGKRRLDILLDMCFYKMCVLNSMPDKTKWNNAALFYNVGSYSSYTHITTSIDS